jgi:hypothetical protein
MNHAGGDERTCTHVQGNVGLGPNSSAPLDELICAELIALNAHPGEL